MNKSIIMAAGLCALVALTGCKSRESAYKQAWEQAQAQNPNRGEQEVVTDNNAAVTPVTPVQPKQNVQQETVDNSDVREIQGTLTVINGNPLKTYSVVVGSFVTQANAESLKARLQSSGYDSRVVKTNETINGHTGWFRVVASSYDDKSSAIQSRNALRQSYPAAWLLYRK